MAETQALIPKARRVLNIRRPWHSERSHFFQLPRELRDIIYEYVLTEPMLWDKRHQSGCPLYRPEKACERPVFKTNKRHVDMDARAILNGQRNGNMRPYWVYSGPLKSDDVHICTRTCRRRKGLGFRQVSKQLHRETEDLFWSSNTFCYTELKDFLHDIIGRCTYCSTTYDKTCQEACILPTMPGSVKIKMRRLSFVEHSEDWNRLLYDHMPEIASSLEQLPNLVKVELPTWYLKTNPLALAKIYLPRLRMIHASSFEMIMLGDPGTPVPLDGYFSKRFHLPACDCYRKTKRVINFPDAKLQWCPDCCRVLGKIKADLMDWWIPRHNGGVVQRVTMAVIESIERSGVPAHPPDGRPYVITLTDPGSEVKHNVRLHGLPVLDIDACEDLRIARQRKERRTAIAASIQRNANRMQLKKDTDEVSYFARQSVKSAKRASPADTRVAGQTGEENPESAMAARQQKREEEARLEARRQKNAAGKERRKLRRCMEQMKLEKKAARSRCSR